MGNWNTGNSRGKITNSIEGIRPTCQESCTTEEQWNKTKKNGWGRRIFASLVISQHMWYLVRLISSDRYLLQVREVVRGSRWIKNEENKESGILSTMLITYNITVNWRGIYVNLFKLPIRILCDLWGSPSEKPVVENSDSFPVSFPVSRDRWFFVVGKQTSDIRGCGLVV